MNPWEATFRSQSWGRYPAEHVVRFVARTFGGPSDRAEVRLLDLGSGPGASTWFMAREGFGVSAIDGSPTAIAQLHERLAAEHLNADARVGDLNALPWADATFDGVVDNAALYCNPLASCHRILEEVQRVLKPGGALLSANFTDRTWGFGLGATVERNGFADVSEGPLAHKGFALFFDRATVDALYARFAEHSVERLAWTLDREQHEIEMWIVQARKASR
ncbi:MAG: class I SAM-dependent methyltransferase [Deltaproteobacteria bacterium]